MTTNRIEQIQKTTAYPDSHSVYGALMQVWNECQAEIDQLKAEIAAMKDDARNTEHTMAAYRKKWKEDGLYQEISCFDSGKLYKGFIKVDENSFPL